MTPASSSRAARTSARPTSSVMPRSCHPPLPAPMATRGSRPPGTRCDGPVTGDAGCPTGTDSGDAATPGTGRATAGQPGVAPSIRVCWAADTRCISTISDTPATRQASTGRAFRRAASR